MVWTPDLDKPTFKKGRGLLQRATTILGKPVKALSDHSGVFAYEYPSFFLCAKKEPYGNIVSCHEGLVDSAIKGRKKIKMFIGNTDTFYDYDPNEIKIKSQKNIRNGVIMLNFNIRLGYTKIKTNTNTRTLF